MHTMFSSTLPPAMSLLVVLGFGALVGLLFLVVKLVSLKMSGWQVIAERFPMRDVSFTGDSFRKQDGVVGDIGSGRRGFFDIRLASEGVCIYPLFARRNPCLIPWSAVRRVSVSDASLLVVVDYERSFEFFLPIEVLPTFQSRLSSELFHKAVSPFEAAKAALKDGTQPRWMTAIAGSAVKLAEKEYEKEKRKHDAA
jgi:hypothetical protein